MFKKLIFFVYSGTGNTLKIAKLIGENSIKKGMDYEVKMIDKNINNKNFIPDNNNLLGIFSPTIGTSVPFSVFKLAFKLPKANGMKTIIISNGAWTKIGPIFLPGYIGCSIFIIALILLLKGYKIIGTEGFGMPHNWTTLFPPYWKKLEEKILNEIKYKVNIFSEKIFSNQVVINRKWDLILGIILLPLSLAYLLVGHLICAKTMYSNFKCNGCGICKNNCPKNAIKMIGLKKKRPYWTFKCDQCMRCVATCPKNAVEGFIPLLVFNMIILSVLPFNNLIILNISKYINNNIFLLIIFSYISILIITAVIYLIFIMLNKINFINKIFSYINPSFYWKKYKEPDFEIKYLKSKEKK